MVLLVQRHHQTLNLGVVPDAEVEGSSEAGIEHTVQIFGQGVTSEKDLGEGLLAVSVDGELEGGHIEVAEIAVCLEFDPDVLVQREMRVAGVVIKRRWLHGDEFGERYW